MELSAGLLVKRQFKNGEQLKTVEVYTTPSRILEANKPYAPDRKILYIRGLKGTDVTRCEYCGKDVLVGDALLDTVYTNGRERWFTFCNDTCKAYRQMGAEG